MPAHAEFLSSFKTALRGGTLPPGLMARGSAEVERRFGVYRNNVAVSLSDALAARFPVIRRLVGEAFFVALARVYAEQDGPKSPILAEWGGGFAEFLAGFPPLAAYPYMADVARIEFMRGRAFHAADATAVDPARLAAADPQRVRLRLHPSVSVLVLDHPAVSIWACNQPAAEEMPRGAGAEIALILRDLNFDVPVRKIGRGDAALLQAILSGESLADAALGARDAERGHDPQPVLVALMRAGAITDARE